MIYSTKIKPLSAKRLPLRLGNAFAMWLLLGGYESKLKTNGKLKNKERKIGNGERMVVYHKKDKENLVICLETGALCENAQERYSIFLQQWLRKGAEFISDLNNKADMLARELGVIE